jgi:hypothetical protein
LDKPLSEADMQVWWEFVACNKSLSEVINSIPSRYSKRGETNPSRAFVIALSNCLAKGLPVDLSELDIRPEDLAEWVGHLADGAEWVLPHLAPLDALEPLYAQRCFGVGLGPNTPRPERFSNGSGAFISYDFDLLCAGWTRGAIRGEWDCYAQCVGAAEVIRRMPQHEGTVTDELMERLLEDEGGLAEARHTGERPLPKPAFKLK